MEELRRYLKDIVEPTIQDFEQNPTSVRHAFLACVTVFHSVDYLAYPDRSANLRQQFRKQSPEFALVDLVAHAFKHVITGDRSKPSLEVHDIISRPPAYFGTAVWDLSNWNDPTGGVTLDQSRELDLLNVVKKTVEFLYIQVS